MESQIQLISHYIESSSIHINETQIPQGTPIQYSIEINISDIIIEDNNSMAQIKLLHSINIGEDGDNLCDMQAVIVGEFKIEGLTDNIKCLELLKNNGVPIISQILRAYMISTTALAGIENVKIPLINYEEFFKKNSPQEMEE